MLDKTEETQVCAVEIPAISVQYAIAFGQDRSLTLTTGVPLSAEVKDINPILDKIVASAERQRDRHVLKQTEMALLNAEQDLFVHKRQFADTESKMMADWVGRNRQGDWRPTGAERQQLENLQKNQDNTVERIKQLRETVKEMRAKCL